MQISLVSGAFEIHRDLDSAVIFVKALPTEEAR